MTKNPRRYQEDETSNEPVEEPACRGPDMDTDTPVLEETDDLADFQPMEESYWDPKYNSYTRGPGVYLNAYHQDTIRGKESYVKLHVGNISKSLSRRAIQNLFGRFGKPLLVSVIEGTNPGYGAYSADTTYGFVTYKNMTEALTALKSLDRKPPHNLRVSFAKDQSTRNGPSRTNLPPPDLPENSEDNSVQFASPSDWDENREKPSAVIGGKSPSSFRPERDHTGPSTESPSVYKQGVFSEFIPSRAVNLHNFNMELLETKYVFKRAPVEKLFPGEFVKVRPGNGILRTKGEKIKRPDVEDCVRCCKKMPSQKCGGRCGARYCSEACARFDYTCHKPICQFFPLAAGSLEHLGIQFISSMIGPFLPTIDLVDKLVQDVQEISFGGNGAFYDSGFYKQIPKVDDSEEFLLRLKSRYSFLKQNAVEVTIEPKPEFQFIETWQLVGSFLQLGDVSLTLDSDFFIIPPPRHAQRLPDDGTPQPPSAAELAVKIESLPLEVGELDCSLPENLFTEVTIVHREGPGDYWILTMNGIRRLLESYKFLYERSPRKGSVVSQIGRVFGYHHNGNWCRIVLTKYSPYTAYLIDFGYCIDINPKEILPLPQELEGFPPLAVRIRMADDSPVEFLNKLVNDTFTVKPAKKLLNSAVLVKSGIDLTECGIPAVELPLSGLCCITAHHTPQAVYVRPLTPVAKRIFDMVTQDVAMYCWKIDKPLEALPNIGEVVGARCRGDNFARAKVMANDVDQSLVIFLDSGSIEKVSIGDLHELPDLFKEIPATAVKVGLKGVQHQLFNAAARKRLPLRTHLFIEHDGDVSRVKLFKKGGKDMNDELLLNDQLKKILMPSYMAPKETTKNYCNAFYLFHDILWATWETSVVVEGVVTNVLGPDQITFICYSPEFDYIREILTPQITEHCNSLDLVQYVPRTDEFVFVKHEEGWYRAVCEIDSLKPYTAQVFFVDYGNVGEVPVQDIRPMVGGFANIPATAKICKIQGLSLPAEPTPDQQERVFSLIEGVHQLVVLEVTKDLPSECTVFVPSLVKPLEEMGILYAKPDQLKLTNGLHKDSVVSNKV